MNLTEDQQLRVIKARELAALPASKVCEYADEDDKNLARAMTLGAAQVMLADLLNIIDELTGTGQ